MMARRLCFCLAAAWLAFAPQAAGAFGAKSLPAVKGADVWFAEDHTIPVVTIVVSLPAGSVYDPPGKSGLAAFAAALMDEGAGDLDARRFHAALADRAIQFAVSPDRDYIAVSLATLSSNTAEAMRLLALALAHPRFDADSIARVRAQMIQDLRQADQDPANVAEKGFQRVFFGGHPYALPVSGGEAGIGAIGAGDLKAFVRSHWVRGGLKVAVAGDIDAAALSALLRSTFASLPDAQPPAPPPVGKLGAPGVHMLAMDVPQPTAVFGLVGMMRRDPDFIAGFVANQIVGGSGMSSRLMHEVREKRGLTYDIATDLANFRRAGVMMGEVATRRDAMRQTIAVVRETLRKFAADGPTDQELADAKTYLTGSFPLAFSSNSSTAMQLSAFQRAGLPVDYQTRRNAMIDAVTIEDVRRAAKRLFDPARLTVVVAGTLADGKGTAK